MNFGNYAVIDNVRHNLEKEPDMWWEFKPPTAREEIAINRFTQGGPVRTSMAGVERDVKTNQEIALEELALTVADTNFEDSNGKKMITKKMDLDQKKEVIRTFPRELFYELWYALGEACPGWGAYPGEDAEEERDEDSPEKEAEIGPKAAASSEN